MALNGPGVTLRKATDEGEDVADFQNNRLQEGWKEWPNEAGVSVNPECYLSRLHSFSLKGLRSTVALLH